MARSLTPLLDAIMTVSQLRQPAYILEIYDIRSDANTRIGNVVRAIQGLTTLPGIVGPRDFTGDIQSAQVSERGGDYVGVGIPSSSVELRIVDAIDEFDPLNPNATEGRWLRQGNVLAIREGDRQAPVADWPYTFVGPLVGQPGKLRDRETGEAFLLARATSRESAFLRREGTSQNFAQGTSYLQMIETIATDGVGGMGLDPDELALPSIGNSTTAHLSTQFVTEPPLTSIAKIMFTDGFLPRFLGDGRLGASPSSVTNSPARVYADDAIVKRVTRPVVDQNAVNVVTILGLSGDMEQILQGDQRLLSTSATMGFFASGIDIRVSWSEDRTQQAQNTRLIVVKSVNDGIFFVGDESYAETAQADGGSVEGVITIDSSAFNIALAAVIAVTYVASYAIPDAVTVGGLIVSGGSTIPIGSLVQGAVGNVLLTIISTQGIGQYEIHGEPFENVFRELRAEAKVKGILSSERQEITVENHLLSTQGEVDVVAERVLRRERNKVNVRSVTMLHDLKIETEDIFQLADGSRIMVTGIGRRLQHGGSGLATIQGFEVTPGIVP